MAISLRLDGKLSTRLASVAKARGISKSELVRTCLAEYLASPERQPSAWDLGKDLFGCFNSGAGDLSRRAKEIARKRIHARRAKASRR